MPGDAFTIKNVVLPSSRRPEADFEAALKVIHDVRLVVRYVVDDVMYLQIVNFDEHQPNLHKRGASCFPAPSGDNRLNHTEREIETVFAGQLETGALKICDFTVTKVDRQVRIGNCYLDIVAYTTEGPVLLLELKRGRLTNEAVAQIRGYIELLSGRVVIPILIGSGVAATLDLVDTQPVSIWEYDDTLMLRSRTSWNVLERAVTFSHVIPTRAGAESNLIQSNVIQENPEPCRPARAADALFAVFWENYPKKRAKEDAQRAWDKRRPNDELLAVMLRALERQKHSPDWQKESGRYIPLPATWLNKARWTDEIEVDIAGGTLSDTMRYNLAASEEAEQLILANEAARTGNGRRG
jgi:hypothetical protein